MGRGDCANGLKKKKRKGGREENSRNQRPEALETYGLQNVFFQFLTMCLFYELQLPSASTAPWTAGGRTHQRITGEDSKKLEQRCRLVFQSAI